MRGKNLSTHLAARHRSKRGGQGPDCVHSVSYSLCRWGHHRLQAAPFLSRYLELIANSLRLVPYPCVASGSVAVLVSLYASKWGSAAASSLPQKWLRGASFQQARRRQRHTLAGASLLSTDYTETWRYRTRTKCPCGAYNNYII